MSSGLLEKALKSAKVSEGSRVIVKAKDNVFEGMLMPKTDSDSDTIVLKLDNGYNLGILFDKGVSIQLKKEEALSSLGKQKSLELSFNPEKPPVSLISSGGTISARVDYRTGGVFFLMDPKEILSRTPELAEIINLRNVISPFRIGSEDMTPKHYAILAKEAAKQLNSKADGVIITHGTDTLHYTSAAMSFMLQGLSKPVALVGAQRSPDRSSFDGAINLICAARYAAGNIGEVAVVMHGSSSDSYCLINRGTKVRKMHTSRRDAFRPVNSNPIGKIWPDGKLEIIDNNYKKRKDTQVSLDTKFEEKTALIMSYPNANKDIFDFYIEKGYKGIVIASTALGHVPTEWLPKIRKAIKDGISVVSASQTLYGSTHPHVYRQLIELDKMGVIFGKDMLPEVAYIKLGWVLGHTKEQKEVKAMMLKNYAGEFNKRLAPSMFLN